MNKKILISAFISSLAIAACASSDRAAGRDRQTPSGHEISRTTGDTSDKSAAATEPVRDADRKDNNDKESAANDEADNTGVNKRDRGTNAVTPIDQSNDETDLEITQKIRQAVVENDKLSFGAKNVKIITVDGKVTLRGPVKSVEERAAIEAAAKQIAGANRVDCQLEVEG